MMRRRAGRSLSSRLVFALALIAFEGATASAQQPRELLSMAADMNSAAMGSSPGSLIVFNNELYFGANDGLHGIEIWKYNGTGVSRITDINPGGNSSVFSQPEVFNGALYFRATDGTNGVELWKYDGANATLAANINAGSASSSPNSLTLFNGALYFSATDGVFGNELWKFDGTTASRVTDINPGSANASVSGLTVFNNSLYFSASNATYGVELWRYNGISASLVSNINPGAASASPLSLTVYNGALYFGATDGPIGGHGRELWKYDGTNVSLVSDINPGTDSSDPLNMIVFNGGLYFQRTTFLGTEMDRYDGTNFDRIAYYVASKAVYNGALYFSAGFTDKELYRYDGTNVSLIADIYPGPTGSFPSSFAVYNGALYFRATDPVAEAELWKYDGTNVSRVADINTGSGSSNPGGGVVFHDLFYFTATTNGSSSGNLFWKFDGTTAMIVSNAPVPSDTPAVFNDQMYLLTDTTLRKYDGTNFTTVASGLFDYAYYLKVFNGVLCFRAHNNTVGDEIWKYDGTNTVPVTNINPGSADAGPEGLTVFNGALYFAAFDGSIVGLWKYDGTAASRVGTLTLPNFSPISNLVSLAVYKGALYMNASSNGTEFEPWKYDGTNFTPVADIKPGSGSSYPYFWPEYRGALILSAYDASGILHLWKYDGSNVTRITDATITGAFYARPLYDTLYYTSGTSATGYELYKYDGTTNSLVADLNPGVAMSYPIPLREYDNALYYNATDGYHGNELWRLDPLALAFRITSIAREGNDIRVTWTTVGGRTNVLQAVTAGAGGGYSTNFADISPVIITPGTGNFTTNYPDGGGASATPARYYRVRLVP